MSCGKTFNILMKPDTVMETAQLPLCLPTPSLGIHRNTGLHLNQQGFCHSLQWSQNFTLQFEILSADDRQVKWLPHCSHCLCVINCAKIIISEVQYRCSLPHSFSVIFHPPLSPLFPYSFVFYSSLRSLVFSIRNRSPYMDNPSIFGTGWDYHYRLQE